MGKTAGKILIVDDNEFYLSLLKTVLKEVDASLYMANSGKDALRLVEENNFALAILDIQMPEMDGYEATQEIRLWEIDKGRHVVIIAMTANALLDDRQRCLQVGMDDYISKPIHPQELKDTLERWIK